jgi:CRP-like cAMP-binding protein
MTPRRPTESGAAMRIAARRTAPWSGWAPMLAEVPLFGGLAGRHLKKVADLADLRWYGDGKTLVREGGPGDAFYAIFEGRAHLQTASGHSRELGPRDWFGELALIDGAPRSATIVSAGGVSAARIERSGFLGLLHDEPAIAVGVAYGLVATVRELQGIGAGQAFAAGAAVGRPAGGEGSADGSAGTSYGPVAAGGAVRVSVPLLATVPLFSELPKRHLRRIARSAATRRYPDGAVVVRAGTRGTVFHVIVEGRARAATPSGRRSELGSGDWFGELALLDGAPRSATVSAVGDLCTLCIARPGFLKLMDEEPGLAAGIVRGPFALIRRLEGEKAGWGGR